MAISKQKKEEVVQDLKEALDNAKIIIFTDFKGVNVKDMTSLRRKVRKSGGKYLVAKKTLINIALKDKKLDIVNPSELEGQIGIAFGDTDSVSTSKAIYEIQKEGGMLKILNGIMTGRVLSAEEVIQFAQLPTREVLLAQVVRSIKSPVSGFVNVLTGNIRALVQVLNAISQKN